MATNYIAQGQVVINKFLTYYRAYNATPLTSEELLSKIINFDHNKYLNIVGYAYVEGIDSDVDKLESAMNDLAQETRGGLPTSTTIIDYMKDQNSTISLIKDIASSTASDIVAGAESFGANALGLLKFLNMAFPLVIIGGIAYFFYRNKDLVVIKK